MAMGYDTPIPGLPEQHGEHLRLWAAKSTREFDLAYFNHGDYERAVADKTGRRRSPRSLPNDNVFIGKELRAEAGVLFGPHAPDIHQAVQKITPRVREIPQEVAIPAQRHAPVRGIRELMRIFVDDEELGWTDAWDINGEDLGTRTIPFYRRRSKSDGNSLLGGCCRGTSDIYEIQPAFLEGAGPPHRATGAHGWASDH